jgi:hypothetical protein
MWLGVGDARISKGRAESERRSEMSGVDAEAELQWTERLAVKGWFGEILEYKGYFESKT